MEGYIVKHFGMSPFLYKFFEVNGLFNQQAIIMLEEPSFQEEIKFFFLNNLEKFSECLEVGNIEAYQRANMDLHLFEILKPGDTAMLKAIQHKIVNMPNLKLGGYSKGKTNVFKRRELIKR